MFVSMDAPAGEPGYLLEPVDELTPDEVFELRWAQTVMQAALDRLRREYSARGQAKLFDRLQNYQPHDPAGRTYAQLGEELGLAEAGVKSAVRRMRERHRELLKETATAPQRGFEWYYWQRQTHLELRTLRGHADSVLAVAYSPDGKRIVTGSRDQTAKLSDATTGKELLTFKGHGDWIICVAFSPDGRRLATASRDHTVRVWDAASPEQVARWEREEQAAKEK